MLLAESFPRADEVKKRRDKKLNAPAGAKDRKVVASEFFVRLEATMRFT